MRLFRAWRRGVYRALRSTILTEMVMEGVPTSESKKKIGDMGMQWIFSIGPSKPTFYPALCLGRLTCVGCFHWLPCPLAAGLIWPIGSTGRDQRLGREGCWGYLFLSLAPYWVFQVSYISLLMFTALLGRFSPCSRLANWSHLSPLRVVTAPLP